MAELQLPKLTVRVRFPSLAPKEKEPDGLFFLLDLQRCRESKGGKNSPADCFNGVAETEERIFGECFRHRGAGAGRKSCGATYAAVKPAEIPVACSRKETSLIYQYKRGCIVAKTIKIC